MTPVFFYSTWNLLSLSEKFSIYVREKSKLSVKQHQKYPWKNRRARESFEKILYVKITFQYVKIYKNYMRENWKVAVKNHGKIFKSTFFGRVFIYFDLFPAVIKKLFAWKQNLWKISILCPWKLKLIREIFSKIPLKNPNCAWNLWKKCTWKMGSIREKNEKKVKKTIHPHFFFSRRKKKPELHQVRYLYRGVRISQEYWCLST